MIVADVDDQKVMANLDSLVRNMERGAPKALLDVGFEIMRLSQMEVPHDEGTLQNSGAVEEINGDVIIGYHTSYAARLHEHPEYQFQKGRKGKYLSDPIINNADVLGLRFGKNLQTELGFE